MDEDEDMDESNHDPDDDDEDEDDEEEDIGGGVPAGSAFERFNQLAAQAGMHIDEDTAAALFGGSFRSMGGMMSGLNNRFKRLKTDLKSKNISTRLAALRECSEVLLVSNEDTLGGAFSTQGFATEFIAILKGKPNIDENSTDAGPSTQTMDFDDDDMDEDAQLARALAMSTEGAMPPGMGMDASEEEMECQLVACRCLAHLLEALPGTGHTLVHLGAVPVLCSKLNEPSYIELAEQTLSVSCISLPRIAQLTSRQWKRSPPNTPPPSSAKADWRRYSAIWTFSAPTSSAQPSLPLPIAVAISPASITLKSRGSFPLFDRP